MKYLALPMPRQGKRLLALVFARLTNCRHFFITRKSRRRWLDIRIRWPWLVTILLGLFVLEGCYLYGYEDISVEDIQDRVDQAPYEIPAGVNVLSEEELLEKIVGNTLAGPSENYGPESVEYLRSDGTIMAVLREYHSVGYWAVSGSLICLYYPYQLPRYTTPRMMSTQEMSIYHCYTLKLDAEIVSYYDQNGRSIPIKSRLLPGNPRSLKHTMMKH